MSALTPVASDDDSGGNSTSLVTFYASAGIEYEIAVDGWRAAQGAIVLNVSQATPSPFAPAILTQPVDLSLVRTNPSQTLVATFSVSATNAATYQWRFNGSAIAGATNDTYTLTGARPADSGLYSVIVANGFGSVLSRNAGLKVLWTRHFRGFALGTNGQVQVNLDANAGAPPLPAQFYVEYTTNLVNWSALTNACVVTNGQVLFDEGASANGPHRFYRILER
ncbi:MAG: hypothetical protein EBS05_21940 [Proteobacteria bacterium]|nr:hypothetical protein [Pseudomonadota bacterium]